MRSTSASSIALLALLASPSFATPIPISTTEPSETPASSGSGIGSAIAGGLAGGAASGVVGNLLNKIEGLFRRDEFEVEHAKRDLASIIQDASALSPDDKQTVKTALMNKISTLQDPDVSARAILGSVGAAAAGGAASAVVGNLLSQIEGLFRRDEFDINTKRDLAGIIQDASSLPPADKETVKTALMNKIRTLEEPEVAARALGAVGSAVAGGAASAIVGNLLGQISNLFRRETQLEGLERRISIEPSSGSSSGGGIGSAIAGGAAAATVGNLLNKIEGLFRRDDSDVYVRRDLASIIQNASSLAPSDKETVKTALMNKIGTLEEPEVAARALGAVGSAVAGGAASAIVGNLLGQISSLFRREAQLEGLVRRISVEPSSGTSSGGGIGSAIAGGAAAATVGNLLNKIEGLFRRDDSDVYVKRDLASIIQDASSLPPSDKESVKTALMNKISTLQEPEVGTRALGAVGSAVAGGAASAVVGNLLSQIEGLFRRDEIEMERRAVSVKPSSSSSGSGIGSAVAGGAAAGVVGNLLGQIEGLFSRDDHEATRRDLASIITDASSLAPTDKETVKTALMNKISTLQDTDVAARGFASGAASTAVGGAASIAANSVVSTLLNKVESLFRRDDLDDNLIARTESWAINELD